MGVALFALSADNQGMSDTTILALITAMVTISCAFISHLDRHHIARRGQLEDQVVAADLAKHNAY